MSEFLDSDATAFGENSERVEAHDDSASSAAMLMRWALRWRKPVEEIAEFIADVQETMGAGTGATREEMRRLRDLIERGINQLQDYVKGGGNRVMAERCLWLLLGLPLAAGADNLADLVKLLNSDKQTVNKCLQWFQKQLPELELLPGQRDEVARETMQRVRRSKVRQGAAANRGS